ncbi:MAG TPA: ATPase, T2SS/T4P/T4SS family [Coxiellaceae bacterium]|nr:ATPase, T2SS/T4P/T4SS family [Coxiellaceae bacterium]
MKNSQNTEQELLNQYAALMGCKVLVSQSDLNPKDRAVPEMLAWCRQQADIVVLLSGSILSANPSSRAVQNCKVVMQDKGIVPGAIYPATQALIRQILENAQETYDPDSKHRVADAVSTQQQRLRILVKEALNSGASDIHMEIREDIARIRFRRHGELYLHAEWLPKLGREVASVAFNKETDQASTHFNPLIPQNASMPLQIDGHKVRLRLASLPAYQGFDVVMRLLTTAEEKTPSLSELGYTPKQCELIHKAIAMPYGAVIIAGPTGSGKTTTLASCMQELDHHRKLYMIEDPVEKIVPSATQVPVNTEQYDRSFASMARTALRMDPDVIVLGEMRDEDTAAVMVRASITGHLVFSTLHSNTAPEIITRLVDLGVSRSLLASPNLLVCLVSQRLAPVLCDACAVPVSESRLHLPHFERWKKVFLDNFTKLRVRGTNCAKCHSLGISGRTVVAEIIWMDEFGRQFINQGDSMGLYHYLRSNGWHTYEDQLLDLVRQGKCDPLDAEKMMGEISIQFRTKNFNYETMSDIQSPDATAGQSDYVG